MEKFILALALTAVSAGAQSATLDIISLNITGGSFSMGAPAPTDCIQVSGFE